MLAMMGTSGHPLRGVGRELDGLVSVLAQRAASERPRWTRAVEPRPPSLLGMTKKKDMREVL